MDFSVDILIKLIDSVTLSDILAKFTNSQNQQLRESSKRFRLRYQLLTFKTRQMKAQKKYLKFKLHKMN